MMNCIPIRIVALALALAGCAEPGDEAANDDHGDAAASEVGKGPHGGRLLVQDGYAVELQIFEEGVPPQYRAWLYRDGQPLPPDAGHLQVVLRRLGGVTDTHSFEPEGDHLAGREVVYEPHSFDVEVLATIGERKLRWDFASYEGRTTIASRIAEQAGVRTSSAGPGVIRDEHEVQGLVTTVEERHARVMARFPGPIRAVMVGVGDTVRTGQPLARIESNVSLSEYTVSAPFAGTVLTRNAAVGDLAGTTHLFEIADLSQLWVDLHLFGADAQHIRPGLPVEVTRLSDDAKAHTRLDRVLPGTATASQSTVARATLDNADGAWRPGAAVRARVTVSEQPVDLAVPLAALQSFRDWQVVFVRVGDEYEIRPLELGRRDSRHVEVLDGLEPGAEIVVEQSYLVKADIEKSGASHDH
jgi:cobalt-zinc-cadmium efflux system membrane fusion protein